MKYFIVLECTTYFLPPMVMKVYWNREVAIAKLFYITYDFHCTCLGLELMHVMCWWKIVKYVLTRERAEPLTSPPPGPGPTPLCTFWVRVGS